MIDRLLAKSYDHTRHPAEPPSYALLVQHSRDVAAACDALCGTFCGGRTRFGGDRRRLEQSDAKIKHDPAAVGGPTAVSVPVISVRVPVLRAVPVRA